jgi:hypothetical protein
MSIRDAVREWWDDRTGRRMGAGVAASPRTELSVQAAVDDSQGWLGIGGRPHDYPSGQSQRIYSDSLEAWRKNPLAWRIVAITTDYVVGDRLMLSSANRRLDRFVRAFWHHPKNRIDLRLEPMCDELSRAGDLFVLLFRNPIDGMSYVRFVTKDRIIRIETAENDWETELAYTEGLEGGGERRWLSPEHPQADQQGEVMLHYSVNRPVGALLGEGDLTTMLPWLQRYSRMLEDRVRLHWALRAFLWIVTVPTEKVGVKREQYRTPPDSGSIIVKDKEESWEAVAPSVNGADAQHDLKAVRGLIDAGSGYPPHWRGEAADANLATAQAMQTPTERHLKRRQDYFVYMLQDIVLQAYRRAAATGKERPIPEMDYGDLFSVIAPEVSRQDNAMLARAARDLAEAFRLLEEVLPKRSERLARLMIGLVTKFAGEPASEKEIGEIIGEAFRS